MNYFVTGATGFIGKFLVGELLKHADAKIHVLVRPSSMEKFEALQKENANMKVSPLALSRPPADSLDEEKEKKWREGLAKDYYLREAVNVLGDMAQPNVAAK